MNLTWLYVAALYAIAVWLARRANADLPRGAAVLFYALVLVFLWRPMTQDVSLVAADVIQLTPPWSEVRAPNRPPITKYDVSNTNIHDVPMQIVPWMHQVRESWRALHAYQGRAVRVMPPNQQAFDGEVVDVAPDGALVVATASGTVHVASAEISIRAR